MRCFAVLAAALALWGCGPSGDIEASLPSNDEGKICLVDVKTCQSVHQTYANLIASGVNPQPVPTLARTSSSYQLANRLFEAQGEANKSCRRSISRDQLFQSYSAKMIIPAGDAGSVLFLSSSPTFCLTSLARDLK